MPPRRHQPVISTDEGMVQAALEGRWDELASLSSSQKVQIATEAGMRVIAGLSEAKAAVRAAQDAEHEVVTQDETPTLRDSLNQRLMGTTAQADIQMVNLTANAEQALERAREIYQRDIANAREARDAEIAAVEVQNRDQLEKAEQEVAVKKATARTEVVAAERYEARILASFEDYCKQVQGAIGFDVRTLIDLHD